jgi:hypothetical protein
VRWAGQLDAVDEVVPAGGLTGLPASLHDAAVAVNLHGRGPESHRVLVAARPRRLIAFANADAEVCGPAWDPEEHEVARWCRLVGDSGMPADLDDLDIPVPASPPAWAQGATLIHPGAASAARRWPRAHWAAVARAERAAGHRVVLTGSTADTRRCRQIAVDAGLPPASSYAGRTDLPGLAAAVSAADVVVCSDTGVAHLATALRRPSVVLFGPVPPSEWGPPPDRPWHVALWAGRRGDPHGAAIDPGLLAITPADVVAAIRRARAAGAGVVPAAAGGAAAAGAGGGGAASGAGGWRFSMAGGGWGGSDPA